LIKVYSPEETKDLCEAVHGGYKLIIGDNEIYGVHCFNDYKPIPVELIKEALMEIEQVFPLHWANVEIYCTPFRPMVWKDGTFTGLEYNGQAFPGVIIMGARRELRKEEIFAITLHELAHCFGYDFIHDNPFVEGYTPTSEYEEFKKLAEIPGWLDKGSLWQYRPSEVLAETVRYFSGGIFTKEPLDVFNGLEPRKEAYDYIMSLMPERRVLMKKEYIVIHHSATKDGIVYRDYDAIKRGHLERGFRDIGYQYVIEKVNDKLTVTPGRPEWDIGAHCPGRNEDSIGICVVGNFEVETPTEEHYQVVAYLCQDIMTRHNIKEIAGHNQYHATACPGRNFDVEKVRQLVYRKEEESLEEVEVIIGGSEITGLLINSTTYVPIRPCLVAVTKAIKEAIDEVIWCDETKTVKVK